MSKGRGKHSRAFNAKVAQLAGRYQVHPSQIQAWKKVPTEGAAGVCGNGQDQKARSDAALVARLYQEIGQLKMERDSRLVPPRPCLNNRVHHSQQPSHQPVNLVAGEHHVAAGDEVTGQWDGISPLNWFSPRLSDSTRLKPIVAMPLHSLRRASLSQL